MKTNYWFAALSPVVGAILVRNCRSDDAWIAAASFQQPGRREHLGRLLNDAMKTTQAELMATPQFDSGRWKLRLERAPSSTDKQFTGRLVSSIAVGFTMLSPLVCLITAYLWARVVG